MLFKQRYDQAYRWINERVGLDGIIDFMRKKEVPVSTVSIWYYFGGISLFLFLVQVITGILLLMYYRPGPNSSYESLQFLVSKVHFGWLVRDIHSWSANLMVLCVFIHMFSVFFMKSYRKPREMTWISGMVLLFLVLAFGFSGYLLPWNELAFFATKVGTDMAGSVPLLGDFIVRMVRGGSDVTGATLTHFFGIHVAALPGIFVLALAFHLFLLQRQGMSKPRAWDKVPESEHKVMPFFPNFAPAPAGIKPEWYFMFMFQTLKMLPATIGSIEGELVGLALFNLGALVWLTLPLWDKWTGVDHPKARWVSAFGGLVVLFIVFMTVLGYVLS